MRKNWTFLGWFYSRAGEQIGPFPPQEITRLVACGELRASEEVLQAWKDENKRIRYFGNHADSCRPTAVGGLAPTAV